MSKVRHEECKHKEHYFEMFLGESIAGGNTEPRKHVKRKRGLGDTVAAVLAVFGIRKRNCKCDKRQSFLNRIFPYN